ncbi:MAG: TonB-dependent receptor [Gammaproteobacteria bacterium]|nr:TonB-dependent receptor [Gammaproteobacteria bacterium]
MKYLGPAGLALFVAAATTAQAQTEIEEIVITAQKREQRLQDVPISVVAMDGEDIRQQNLVQIEDLSAQVPNVHISESAIGDKLFIRGIGSGINSGFEQSVGTFVDGVYYGRSLQTRAQVLDVERVEVLRGPQSTYFGNNTIGGALNITTRNPGDSWNGYVSGLYEAELDGYHVEAVGGGPVTDGFGIRAAVLASGTEGWLHNLNTGTNEPEEDNLAGRITLTLTPSDRFDATLKLGTGSFEVLGRALQNVDCPPATGAQGVCRITALPVLATVAPFAPFNAALYPNFDDSFDWATQANGPVPAAFLAAVNLLGATEAGMAVPAPKTSLSEPDLADLTNRSLSLTMNVEIGTHVLTSVTGINSYDFDFRQQSDFVPVPLASLNQNEDFKQFSQELRLTSPAGGKVEYVAGIYWQSSDLEIDELIDFYFAPPYFQPRASFLAARDPNRLPATIGYVTSSHQQDEETFAAFLSFTWNITGQLSATFGGRYSTVDKDLSRSQTLTDSAPGVTVSCIAPLNLVTGCTLGTPLLLSGANPPTGEAFGWKVGTLALERDDDKFTPSIGLQWRVNDSVLAYASFAQGFKAGGFDQRNLFLNPVLGQFAPEQVDSWELGAKTSWLGGRLQLNGALFRSKYEDLQVSTFDGVVNFLVNNAASATTQGFELDGRLLVNDRLAISLSGAYLDAEWDDYRNAQCTAIAQFRAVYLADRSQCQVNASGLLVQDLTGERLLMAPKWSGNLLIEYSIPLSEKLAFNTLANLSAESRKFLAADNDPAVVQPGYGKFDARFSLSSSDGWEIALLGKNLTNKLTTAHGEDQPLRSSNSFFKLASQPRTIAVQASYHW